LLHSLSSRDVLRAGKRLECFNVRVDPAFVSHKAKASVLALKCARLGLHQGLAQVSHGIAQSAERIRVRQCWPEQSRQLAPFMSDTRPAPQNTEQRLDFVVPELRGRRT
jgi:hypothetical protein